jgi:D-alanyl-D-alanine carboxypeptidase
MNLFEQYKGKIITIIVLIAAILISLLVLGLKSCAGKKAKPEPTPTPEITVQTPEPTVLPTFEPTPEPTPSVDITSDDSITRYVSQAYPISDSYVPSDLRVVNVHSASQKKLRAEAADKLEEMFKAAIADRIYLKLVDGYRSYREQADLYSYYKRTKGESYANSVDDHPGASEHQLGLAADLGNWNGACELQYCFTGYLDYAWLKENSWKYGWIERYPEGSQSKTGIVYSPWHYRYVGVEEAEKIHESGKIMEDYYNIS